MFSVCQTAVFLLSISPRVVTDDTEKAVLEIQYPPIVFGEDAYLYCNLSSIPDCCSNTVTWMKNQYIIIHHGASVNNFKYTQTRMLKGFCLQIKHFESTDMNVTYSCLYEFISDSKYLQINEYDFEMLPSTSSTFINTTVDPVFYKIVAELLFEKVFPRPNCTLLADDQELETETEIDWSMNGLFYRTTIVLSAKYTTDMCGRSINIACTIGRNKRIDNLDSNRTINCSDIQQTTFTERSYQSSIIISIISLLVCTALLIAGGIYRFRKHKNRRLSIENDEEEKPLLGQVEVFFQNDETKKTAGYIRLENAVRIMKSLRPDEKDIALVGSNNEIRKQMKTYKDQGKYDEKSYRGNGLFPPKHHYSRDPDRSIPFQRAKDLEIYFMSYVQMEAKPFPSQDEEEKPLLGRYIRLGNAVRIMKSFRPDEKDIALVGSNNEIRKQMTTYKDQGKYDEKSYRGNGLFPPKHHYSRDSDTSTPFQRAKDVQEYFMHYVQIVVQTISFTIMELFTRHSDNSKT